MKKRIIIFADGTWNSSAHKDNNQIAQTNVFQCFAKTLKETCPNGDTQYVYYEEGVGTGNAIDKFVGGVTGKGIDDNILGLYRFIIERYTIGTEIFLFGFSRGAYTVRSLAGLIRNCGILKKDYISKADRAFFIYRNKRKKYHPESDESKFFREHFSYPIEKTPIRFIGVWDTVGSLGIPVKIRGFRKRKYCFHDVKLGSIIQNAYHALALDEKRVFFAPTLWQQETGEKFKHQKLEQVWFCGVHCDVGGGYSQGELYKLPMSYLITRAIEHGLNADYQLNINELNTSSKSIKNESRKSFYRLIPKYNRIVNKQKTDVFFVKRLLFNFFHKVPDVKENLPTNEFLHISVIERYQNENRDKPTIGHVIDQMPVVHYSGEISTPG